MDSADIRLIQTTWQIVAADSDGFTRLFYQRLFSTQPDIRSLFPEDMAGQREKLAAILDTVITALANFDTVSPAIAALGQRHRAYGVQDSHYEAVGVALLDTLKVTLGAAFTPETRQAWVRFYAKVTELMQTTAA